MLSLPPEMILTIFNFLDDKSWLHLRLTCHYLNRLPDDNVKRYREAYQRAQDELRRVSIEWFDLYQETYNTSKCATLRTRDWMKLYTKVYNLFTRDESNVPDTKIVLRCIELSSSDKRSWMKSMFQYYLRNYNKLILL